MELIKKLCTLMPPIESRNYNDMRPKIEEPGNQRSVVS